MVKTRVLYGLTALLELLGCYLPYLWLRQGRSPLLLISAASGRVYAAYGAVYVSMALLWLRLVDGVLISAGPPRP